MTRILIVKIGAIGDVVYAMPMLGAIHEVAPKAQVSWLVGESCADLLRGHKHLHKIFTLSDKNLFSTSIVSRLSVVKDLVGKLNKAFDLVLIAHRDPAYAFALRPFIWGPLFQLSRDDSESQIRHTVHVPALTTHESLAMRKLLEAGIKHLKLPTEFKWDEPFDHIFSPAVGIPESFIAVHVGGGVNIKTEFALKQWPHSVDFIRKVLEFTKFNIVVIGSSEDRRDAERSLAKLEGVEDSRIVNMMGKTSMRDLVGIIRKAKLFVGPDSGPLHIADSLRVPTIGLYGPTSHVSWGLLGEKSRAMYEGVECSPCYKDTGAFPPCPNQHRCMKELMPTRVLDQALFLLGKSPGHGLI
ncbi:MAG: glycosyltransferase family 9 protein [Bdellovibrionia bacterium]